MKYDFDEIIPRRLSGCYKWDSLPSGDIVPMWVADMEFKTAPAILEALHKRVDHGVFGYTWVSDDYYQAIINWFATRHDWRIEKDWILYTTGVVPAISAIIKAFTEAGDKVIMQTPAFNCFFSSIKNNGCTISENPLKYENGTYSLDFEDLQAKASDPRAKLLLFCSPQNPSGRVWSRQELEKVAEICAANHVIVVADEIHCEFVAPGFKFIPLASLSSEICQNCIVCNSPSKAFNIAGLQIANIVVADKAKREKINRALNDNEVCEVNPFGVLGLMAAYNESGDWLEELKAYIHKNYLYLKERLAEDLPQFRLLPLEGTYLAWLDCSHLKVTSQAIADYLLENQHLKINPGTLYGSNGEGFVRINIASPLLYVKETADKLREGLRALEKEQGR